MASQTIAVKRQMKPKRLCHLVVRCLLRLHHYGIQLSLLFGVGGDLLSHNLPVAVPSACAGLASGFGMGPGVSLQLLTTDKHTKHSNP